ncbi:hypothetical protein Taro_027116 [Colocasia esculenta]|uniref:CCHC-type domain-containing protein n=1 Tax=Colocasia esculenta TaxID=4460 RepID=A0A843VDN9_COLES|nr:hypothetical protein [Colocasia esculenta]
MWTFRLAVDVGDKGVDANLSVQQKFLKWLIEEIGVVEEMIRRKAPSTVGASKGKAPAGPSSSGFGKWGQKLKQAFKGKGRGWGGRQQLQQGRGRPEVEESQQSTARQPMIPPGYRCYNCNQLGHLIRNCPYAREYGYGRGVQQQQQPQQFQQPQAGRGRGAPQQRGRGRVMAITRAQAEASNMIEDEEYMRQSQQPSTWTGDVRMVETFYKFARMVEIRRDDEIGVLTLLLRVAAARRCITTPFSPVHYPLLPLHLGIQSRVQLREKIV